VWPQVNASPPRRSPIRIDKRRYAELGATHWTNRADDDQGIHETEQEVRPGAYHGKEAGFKPDVMGLRSKEGLLKHRLIRCLNNNVLEYGRKPIPPRGATPEWIST